jgi:hypothetical protein
MMTRVQAILFALQMDGMVFVGKNEIQKNPRAVFNPDPNPKPIPKFCPNPYP